MRAALAVALLAVLLAGGALARPAGAAPAVVVGNGTPASCDESAFDLALAAGGTITFDCGGPKTILFSSAKLISGTLTIDGANIITLSGNQTTRLFVVNAGGTLSLRHITLEKGNSGAADGGAIDNSGVLVLNGALIQNNQTDLNHSGGAIATRGPLSITNSTLSHNQAGSGGAIYASSSAARVQVVDTSVDLNKALQPGSGDGGGLWLAAAASLSVTGSQFFQNSAQHGGGALALSSGAAATFTPHGATRTFLFNNSADSFGGAIYNETGLLVLRGALIQSNHTLTTTAGVGFGGGLADDGALTVTDSLFQGNVGRSGGGLWVGGVLDTPIAAITHTQLLSNSAVDKGGGLFAIGLTATVSIETSSFEANQAGSGGGLTRENAHLSISRSSFTLNTATHTGGLLLFGVPSPDSAGYVEIRDSTISSNSATSPNIGGIGNSALVDLRNVTIKDNHIGLYDVAGATARLQSSALDNTNNGGRNCDGDGTLPASGGFNYATDSTCVLTGFQDTQGNGLDTILGPLVTDPGVITFYHLPVPGSPLINQGGIGCSLTDQRGALRPDACDIGAVEFDGLLPRLFMPLLFRP
jgi:hypothetical protein